jgi:hypothetical protein
VLASLCSQVAINRGVAILAVAEQTNGLNWGNVYEDYQNYSVFASFIMMFFSGLLTSLLGLWLDNVVQQEFGTAKDWDYCLNREYYGCKRRQKNKKQRIHSQIELQNLTGPSNYEKLHGKYAEDYYMDKKNYEPVTNPELVAQEQDE